MPAKKQRVNSTKGKKAVIKDKNKAKAKKK